MTKENGTTRFVIEYELDYKHRVQVGVVASSADEAAELAECAFNSGTLWDDTAEMPLLFDDYEEAEGNNVLLFQVVTTVKEWPAPDASVISIHRGEEAMLAARYLVEAVNGARSEGKPLDLGQAYGAALAALGLD